MKEPLNTLELLTFINKKKISIDFHILTERFFSLILSNINRKKNELSSFFHKLYHQSFIANIIKAFPINSLDPYFVEGFGGYIILGNRKRILTYSKTFRKSRLYKKLKTLEINHLPIKNNEDLKKYSKRLISFTPMKDTYFEYHLCFEEPSYFSLTLLSSALEHLKNPKFELFNSEEPITNALLISGDIFCIIIDGWIFDKKDIKEKEWNALTYFPSFPLKIHSLSLNTLSEDDYYIRKKVILSESLESIDYDHLTHHLTESSYLIFGEECEDFKFSKHNKLNMDKDQWNYLKESLLKKINEKGIIAEILFIGCLEDFSHIADEYVFHMFNEEGVLGLNTEKDFYPEMPRNIYVRIDHPFLDEMGIDQLIYETLFTIYHEEGHIVGHRSEENADKYAKKILGFNSLLENNHLEKVNKKKEF